MSEFSGLTHDEQVRLGNRLQKIGRMIEREMEKATGKRVGFCLITFDGEGGEEVRPGERRSQYVANITRESAKEALAELLSRWGVPGEELGIPKRKLGGMN